MSVPGVVPFRGGDRFAIITPDDHGGLIWIASLLGAIFTMLTFFLRYFVKRNYRGLDDWVALAATITAEAQFISIFCALSDGLGKAHHLLHVDIEKIGNQKAVISGQVFFLVSLCLAKVSVILLLRRLFSPDMARHLIVCDGLLVLCVVWGVGSILGVSVNCSPSDLMGVRHIFCSSLTVRWKTVGAIDAVIEILVFIIPIVVVWKLHIGLDRKARVILAFAFRLPLVAFAILHAQYVETFTRSSNTGVALSDPLIYQQIGLCYALVSCTIPNLQGFLSTFHLGMGFGFGYGQQPYGSQGASIQLKSLKSNGKARISQADGGVTSSLATLRPEQVDYSTTVHHAPRPAGRPTSVQEDESLRSINSRNMIIRKDIRFSVHYGSS